MRRGSILTMLLIGAVAFLAAGAVAVFIPWLPEQASKEREGIDLVFWLATWICIAIFAIVAAVIGYAFLRFRVREDDDTDGVPIHGHTGLEIVWTAVPLVLVVALGITSAVVLTRNDKARGSNANEVSVTAQQFSWTFKHPNGVTSATLRIPVGRSTVLLLHSRDVIHSFWVPQFGQKRDAVPGIETRLVITPKRTGTFPVICTELCGLGHSLMRARVIVMPQAAYASWAKQGGQTQTGQTQTGQTQTGQTQGASGQAVFDQSGCSACHTFTPAHATGKVGPDLDKLPNDPAFVRQSIVDPNAKITAGYPANVMPQTFGQQLSKEQLDALVQYLVGGGG